MANEIIGLVNSDGTEVTDARGVDQFNPSSGTFNISGALSVAENISGANIHGAFIGNISQQVSVASIPAPPSDADLTATFGSPSGAGIGFTTLLDLSGAGTNFYQVVSDGTDWWTFTGTKAE